ncbi:MAG: cyclase family protein [Deltaproteobacteria bacterium]
MDGNKNTVIIDLTNPLDEYYVPFSRGNYTDPPLEVKDWSSISREGFRVSRISLGTQSGTHIDAPAHFLENGVTLESLSPEQFIGKYFLLNLPNAMSLPDVAETLKTYRGEKILFLRTPENQSAKQSREAIQLILSLPSVLLVLSGDIDVDDAEPFAFHRLVATAAKFLVEDLDQKEAHRVTGKGEIFIFPLRLSGVSGSPCRVVARIPGKNNR